MTPLHIWTDVYVCADEHTVCILVSKIWRSSVTVISVISRIAGGQDMKFSWKLLRPSWPRMHWSPRLMSVEHCNASQDSSLDFVSANLFQQEYWLESAAPVSIRLWTICYHHMQILSFKTFCCQISQRFRLAESELYSCFHILPDTFVGELNITP